MKCEGERLKEDGVNQKRFNYAFWEPLHSGTRILPETEHVHRAGGCFHLLSFQKVAKEPWSLSSD